MADEGQMMPRSSNVASLSVHKLQYLSADKIHEQDQDKTQLYTGLFNFVERPASAQAGARHQDWLCGIMWV